MLIELVVFLVFLYLIKLAITSGGSSQATAQTNFVSGIQKLDKALVILMKSEIHADSPFKTAEPILQRISFPIRQAHKYFERALEHWKYEHDCQNKQIEALVSSINTANNCVSQKKNELEKLKKELQTLTHQLKDSRDQFEEAVCSLSSARDALADSERQLRENINKRNNVALIGLLVSPIPYVGWVVGPTMVLASLTVLQEKVKAARSGVSLAEDYVHDCKNKLEEKQLGIYDLQRRLSQEELDFKSSKHHLSDLEWQLEEKREIQRKYVEKSEKLKKTCHVMTTIWGKTRVLNNEARDAYCLEPLLIPLKEIFSMFTPEEQTKIKQNTVLLLKEIDFLSISLKLKTVCDAFPDHSMPAILDEYT